MGGCEGQGPGRTGLVVTCFARAWGNRGGGGGDLCLPGLGFPSLTLLNQTFAKNLKCLNVFQLGLAMGLPSEIYDGAVGVPD